MPPLEHVYAVLIPLRVECPTCRTLIQVRKGLYHTRSGTWDPHTQRLYCAGCRRTYAVGILLWDEPTTSHKRVAPPDIIPSYEQLGELRKRTGGFWTRQTLKLGGSVNRYLENACTCHPAPWRPSCPVHGDDARVFADGGEEPTREPGVHSDRVWAGDKWRVLKRPPKKKGPVEGVK